MTTWRERLFSWEGFLLAVLVLLYLANVMASPFFLTAQNQINMFQLSIEKVIVALVMAFVIINGEIDLSVASVMGLCGLRLRLAVPGRGARAGRHHRLPAHRGALRRLQRLLDRALRIPSLVVTLATMIAFRGFARVLVEDRGIGSFPDWFGRLGQKPLLGPFPLSMLIFVALAAAAWVVLQRTAFGRKVTFIGANRAVAEYSGVEVGRVKATIFVASSTIAAVAGLLYAARLGAIRGDIASGFELDIITIVLLGGVSIFGGVGTITGTVLAILIVLALRNGMALADLTGHIQSGILGLLLILSVMVPVIRDGARRLLRGRAEEA
jgi:rhamnose transport system permease protein